MSDRSTSRTAAIIALAAVALFLSVSLTRLNQPGLYYDEALFVNAATGADSPAFIDVKWGDVPITLMPYIGALKAWLYTPIFSVFGVSIVSIRLPMVVIAVVTLLLIYKLLRVWLDPVSAALGLALVATDPFFVFMSRVDFGPTGLMMLCKTTALMFLVRFLQTGSLVHALGLVISLLAGTFDKLNFLWFATALLIAAAVVYGNRLWMLVRDARWPVLTALAIGGAGMVGFGLRAVSVSSTSVGEVEGDGVRVALVQLLNALDGRDSHHLMLATPFEANTLSPWWILVVLLVLGLRLAGYGRRQESDEALGGAALISLTGVGVLAALWLTPGGRGPHHYMVFYPLHLLAGLLALKWLSSRLEGIRPGVVAALVSTLFLLSNLSGLAAHYRSTVPEADYRTLWSPRIYELAAALRAPGPQDASALFVADWGLGNQLQALSGFPASRVHDVWPWFDQPWDNGVLERRFSELGVSSSLLVLLSSSVRPDSVARTNVSQLVRRIEDAGGTVTRTDVAETYELVRIDP